MQAWWRVLRGVWPYKFLVIVSIVCAFGVGLSYAAGVGVMLPVLKIFISAEGVHGMAYRTAVEQRLNIRVLPLENSIQKGRTGLSVESASKDAAPELQLKGTDAKGQPTSKEYVAIEGVRYGTVNV